ncbi:MAG: hypothetical protein R2715_21805 [Ilumatobacteraceae bacterium]
MSGSYENDLDAMRELIPKLLADLALESNLEAALVSFIDSSCCGGAIGNYPFRLDTLGGDVGAITRTGPTQLAGLERST